MRFSDIPGQEELKTTLIGAYQRNHVAHAQLFTGNPGSAVMPMALAYATYLLCEKKTEQDSCGKCSNCQRTGRYVHPDVHFFYPKAKPQEIKGKNEDKELRVQADKWRQFLENHSYGSFEDWVVFLNTENRQNQISKDDARQLIRTVSMKSFEGGFKIIFIWYPETMHPSAANAILKVLEEPPEKTIYLLVSYNYESLLTTILSRTQLINVHSFSDKDLETYLQAQKGTESAESFRLARLADGDMNVLRRLLEQSASIDYQEFREWMLKCFRTDFSGLINHAEEFNKQSKSRQRSFLSLSLTFVRNTLLSTEHESLLRVNDEELNFIHKFRQQLAADVLEKIYLELNQAIFHLERNANPKITMLALSNKIAMMMKRKVHAA
jgi:DNA polymerase-3 subunit delta'